MLNCTGLKAVPVKRIMNWECLAISSEYLPARGARRLHAWSVGRQIKQEEAGREIFSGNSGGGERQKEPHAPFSRTVVSC